LHEALALNALAALPIAADMKVKLTVDRFV
jgi:hypothetical protein